MLTLADSSAFGTANKLLYRLYLSVVSGSSSSDAVHAGLNEIAMRVSPLQSPQINALFLHYVSLIALYLPIDAGESLRAAALPVPPTERFVLPSGFPQHGEMLAELRQDGVPGISLVTCCMNRNENLLKALPSWLALTDISEILIVDWSSDVPVADELERCGFNDPRIRILRIENEPRWILSYAFNAGFRAASCNNILKVDADIVISEDFFQRNVLPPNGFIAGNWRNAVEGQGYVNGFFYIPRQHLAAVGGFNEFITTYGWDDDDIYSRLMIEGFHRTDVAADTVHHLPHDDEARGADGPAANDTSAAAALQVGTMFLIRRNRYIANVMPTWSAQSQANPFNVRARNENTLTLERSSWLPSVVPTHVIEAARVHALTEMASWKLGARVRELSPTKLMTLLTRPLPSLHRLDIEIALSNQPDVAMQPGHYLALSMSADVLQNLDESIAELLQRILLHAQTVGLKPVVIAPSGDYPSGIPEVLRAVPLVQSWQNFGKLRRVAPRFAVEAQPQEVNEHFQVELTVESLDRLKKLVTLRKPTVQIPRPKFFLDAQHGLGNRLRAVASAMSIAAGTGRELVIIWEPDIHCDCRLSDLLEYDGAVLEERFLSDAADRGCAVFNYMPHEPKAQKDAPIKAAPRKDIYARTAFVLNSPHSEWNSDNANLRSLRPAQAVRDLVDSVPKSYTLSAHVRMEAGEGQDNNAWDQPVNWRPEDHELIHEWRAKSHFSRFMNRIDEILGDKPDERLFVAADLPETYAKFAAHYGDRVVYLSRRLYDRSAEQVRYALADALLLSKASRMLGSTWSSFSELAQRLAPERITVEMSGKDF